MKRIVLASTSPRRKELLSRLRVPFEVLAGAYEEQIDQGIDPTELVLKLARGKAQSVVSEAAGALIIAADTVVVLGQEIMGKPRDSQEAQEMLARLSGKQHQIVTGYVIVDTQSRKEESGVVKVQVWLRNLSPKEIQEYVASGEPLDKAGAYAVQGLGSTLVDRMEGDFSAAMGLPIKEIEQKLKNFGGYLEK